MHIHVNFREKDACSPYSQWVASKNLNSKRIGWCLPLYKGGNNYYACSTSRHLLDYHKRRAMQHRFGAYITHFHAMINDSSVKPADKAKLTGYRRGGHVQICCAMYIVVLRALSLWVSHYKTSLLTFCKGSFNLFHHYNLLSRVSPEEWPTVKLENQFWQYISGSTSR